MMAVLVLFAVWLGGAAVCSFIVGVITLDDEFGGWAFLCAVWPLWAIAAIVGGPFYVAFWLGKKLREMVQTRAAQEGEANG